MGNHPTKQQQNGQRPKKYVHWKSAEPPSPPGKPIIISPPDVSPDIIVLKWDRPLSDGGSPIMGYFIEHRRTGSPHWVRAHPSLIPQPELSLSGLEPGWRYQFRIIAANIVGPSEPSDLSETLTVTLQRNAVTCPRFTTELEDQVAVENEKVTFHVIVDGVPLPQIGWFKDGFEVFSNRRMKIVNENSTSTLIIHQAALTDEGEVKCSATNRAGHVVTLAQLKVEAPPKIRLPRQYEDGLLIEADEIIRLKVGIAGRPNPTVVWSHNGEMITNSARYELQSSEKNSSLKIARAQRSDRGEYHLRAINKLGEDSVSFLLTVTAKPSSPGKVMISQSSGKSVTLIWAAPNDDGGCMIGNYIVEYFRIGWNVWLKATTTRQLTATLNDLIEGSEYRFRVKAESPYGLSDPSGESDTLFIPDPKRGIITPLTTSNQSSQKIKLPTIQVNKSENKDKYTADSKIEVQAKFKHKKPAAVGDTKIDKSIGNDRPMSPVRKDPPLKIVEGKLSLDGLTKLGSSNSKINRSPSPLYANITKQEEKSAVNNSLTSQETDKLDIRNTNYNLTTPRDNHDEVHTSNEFMLVLYDDKKTMQEEKDPNDSDIDEVNIPPPLSLSAPELGSEPPIPPILRHCVSSTELLFEKAMQRVYQTMQQEEEQAQRNQRISKNVNQAVDEQCSQKDKSDSRPQEKEASIDIPVFRVNPPNIQIDDIESPEINHKNPLKFDEDNSDEDFEDERDLKQEILLSQKLIGVYRHDTPQSSVDYADDYTDSTASSASSLDSLEKFIVAVKSVKTSEDQELETYHPQMGPNLGIGIQLSNKQQESIQSIENDDLINQNQSLSDSSDATTSELKLITRPNIANSISETEKNNSISLSPNSILSDCSETKTEKRPLSPYRLPDADQSTIELNRPLPLPDPDFVPKPILKRPSATEQTPQQPSAQTEPKEKPKPEKKGILQLFTSKKSNSNSSLTSSQDALKTSGGESKKDEVISPIQKTKMAVMQKRQSSIEENKVVIDHYSDLVKEYGNRKSYFTTFSNDSSRSGSKEMIDTTPTSLPITETSAISKIDSTSNSSLSKLNNVPMAAKTNESYSRSIFAIKLSKDNKKSSQVEIPNQNVDECNIEKIILEPNVGKPTETTVEIAQSTELKQNKQNTKSISEKSETEDIRGKSTVPIKKKPIRNRSRSSSAVRSKLDSGNIQKPLRSESKSPITKNRKSLPTKQSITIVDECRYSPESRCQTPEELLEETKTKVKSTVSYVTDLAMFAVACWVYIFKDARWALPILALMIYRQAVAALKDKCPKWIKFKSN